MSRESAVEQLAGVVHEMLATVAWLEDLTESDMERRLFFAEWDFCSKYTQKWFSDAAQELRRLRIADTPDFTPWCAAIDDVLEHAEALQAALRRGTDIGPSKVMQELSQFAMSCDQLSDRDIVMAALQRSFEGDDRMRHAQRHLCMRLAQWALVGGHLESDREIVMRVLSKCPPALRWASDELKDDYEVVMHALSRNENLLGTLEFASSRLRSNPEIIKEVYMKGCFGREAYREEALKHASDDLMGDYEFIKSLASYDYYKVLEHASDELKDNQELVMMTLSQRAAALEYASDRLKGDRETVMFAISKHWTALKFASEELRNDRDLVLSAIEWNGRALEFASDNLKADHEVVSKAVSQDWRALRYASDDLMVDKDIYAKAWFQSEFDDWSDLAWHPSHTIILKVNLLSGRWCALYIDDVVVEGLYPFDDDYDEPYPRVHDVIGLCAVKLGLDEIQCRKKGYLMTAAGDVINNIQNELWAGLVYEVSLVLE